MSSRIDPALYPRQHEWLADHFGAVVRKLLPELADALQTYAADGLDPIVAARLSDTARLLREEASVRADVAIEHFVGFNLNQQSDEPVFAPSIIGVNTVTATQSDPALLEQILARELANAIRSAFGGSYVNYLRRLEALAESPMRDDQHPLGARALAMALMMALKPFTHIQPTSLHLRPLVLSMAVRPLARLLADCDASLRAAGVLGELDAASVQLALTAQNSQKEQEKHGDALAREAEGSYTGIFTVDETDNAFVRHASHQVLNDIRASAVMAANPLATKRHRLSAHRNAALVPPIEEIERDAVVFARQCNVPAYSQEARTEFFRQVRQQVVAAGGDSHVLTVVDLVASLFDYAASDRRLPEGARILLWRLQMPAITLASLDAGYLGDDSRSIRRLTEQLAAIAISYPDEMRPNKVLYRRLQTVVRAVEIVAHAFHVRSQVLSEQVDQEYQRATAGMRQLLAKLSRSRRDSGLKRQPRQANRRDYSRRPPPSREKVVSEDIRRLLEHRLGESRVPESVTLFLYDVWLRHLRTAVLRDGTDSQTYRLALQVVDNLLWTLGQEGADPRVRKELVQSIPPLLSMLTSGIRQVGENPQHFQHFFDEIFLIHVRRMQGQGGSALTVIQQAHADDPSADPQDHAGGESASAAGAKAPGAELAPATLAAAAALSGHAAIKPATVTSIVAPAHDAHQHADAEAAVLDHAPARQPLHAATSAASPHATPPTLSDPCSAIAAGQHLNTLIAEAKMDDLPEKPRRFKLPAERFAAALKPGRWVEVISRSGRVDYAKVVWINERKTMALLLLASDRRIMTRQINSLLKRVRQGRLHFVW